jgi:hypothetical protein
MDFPKWLDRYPVVDADHLHDLEQRAAINEFHRKMPRHVAEQTAHDDYRKDQLVEAAAHHLVGMKAAHGAGDMESAKKHGAMYMLACKALGHNDLEPPPEVAVKAKHTPAQVYKFRAHKGDAFVLPPADSKSNSQT